ncbi:MAG: hypothetical protein ACRCXK_05890 [Wohlfahrtiimonas sp.]
MIRSAIFCLPLLPFLMGCDNESISQSGTTQNRHIKEQAKFRVNPDPQKQYQLIINIENAPGPLKLLQASAGYEAPNCTYVYGIASAVSHPRISIPIDLELIKVDQYQGRFNLDAMKDEDYYGQGICQWKFTSGTLLFSAGSSENDTKFSASFYDKEVQVGVLEFNHLKEDYPVSSLMNGYSSSGRWKKGQRGLGEYFTFQVDLREI